MEEFKRLYEIGAMKTLILEYIPTKTTVNEEFLRSCGIKIEIDTNKQKMKISMPEKYIINEDATILFWEGGTKTVVKRCKEDKFDKRLGFLIALFQHYSGMSKNKANKFLAELEVEETKEIKKPKHMKKEN